MKFIIAAFLILSSYSNIFAQDKQLILHVPQQNETSINNLQKQLNAMEGIHFSGYVKDASCILLRYSSTIINDDLVVIGLIKRFNKKLKCKIVKGYTAFEVIDGKYKPPFLCVNGK